MRGWLKSVLPLFLVLMVVGPEVVAQPEPPAAIRRPLEEAAVLVRVYNQALQQTEATGTGLIASGDETALKVLTAAHVIATAQGRGDLTIEVKFFGRNAWAEAKPVALSTAAATELDLAVLTVDQRASPFGRGYGGPQLATQAVPEPGTRVWALGADTSAERLEWRACFVNHTPEGQIIFDGRGVRPGYSGGILTTATGLLGMVQQQGSVNSGHMARTYATLVPELDAAAVQHPFARNPNLDALRHAAATRLTLALFVVDYRSPRVPHGLSFWTAIELDRGRTDGFAGRAFSGGELREANRVEFSAADGGLEVTFSQEVGWPNSSGGRIPNLGTQELTLTTDSSYVLDGFAILSKDFGDRRAFLAIPTGAKEMLASRMLREAVLPAEHYARPRTVPGMLSDHDQRRDRAPTPFALTLSHKKFAFEFSSPAWLTRDEGLRLNAVTLWGDIAQAALADPEAAAIVSSTPIGVIDVAGTPIAQQVLGRDKTPLEFVIPAGHPKIMGLMVDKKRLTPPGRGGEIYGLMLNGLTIEYEALNP